MLKSTLKFGNYCLRVTFGEKKKEGNPSGIKYIRREEESAA